MTYVNSTSIIKQFNGILEEMRSCDRFLPGLCVHPSAGHLDVVCLLVSQGAEISCKDKRGYTPLHTAASSGQIAVVKHLLNLAVEVRIHVRMSSFSSSSE